LVIVDTSVWIDYLAGAINPHTNWLDAELGRRRIGLTSIILCEVLQGVRHDSDFSKVQREMMKFVIFDTGNTDLAIASALNYRRLRSTGVTVRKTIDCLIATFCISEGHSLLHRDRDYDHFEKRLGLHVIRP
jgi:predicted nucleic acid-binding protein